MQDTMNTGQKNAKNAKII